MRRVLPVLGGSGARWAGSKAAENLIGNKCRGEKGSLAAPNTAAAASCLPSNPLGRDNDQFKMKMRSLHSAA